MTEEVEGRFDEDFEFGKKYLKKYWKYTPLAIGGAIAAVIIGLLVFLWYVQISPLGGNGTWTFDQWSVDTLGSFIIRVIFWEFLLVFLPFAAYFGGAFGLFWFKIMTEEERQEIRQRNDKEKERTAKRKKVGAYGGSGGGGFPFLLLIISLIIIWVDGNTYSPFGLLTYSYFIYVSLWSVFWVAICIGIPFAVIGILWLWKTLQEVEVDSPKKTEI